ncbi:MAG: hypothetical protein ABSG04_11245 [Verrucomicrobiota bacterium]
MALTVAASLACVFASAQVGIFDFSYQQGLLEFTFKTNGNPNGYYVLESSTDLLAFTTPVLISFSSNAPPYQTAPTNAQGFFLGFDLSLYAPQSSLKDGMDDVFKLDLGLNPLNPNLAGSFSGHYDGSGHPLTWLQYYNQNWGRSVTNGNVYARETSVFNFGAPFAKYDALSREVSMNMLETPDAVSREISLYNAGEIPPSGDAVSREISVFNTGQAAASYEAISRSISVFNTGQAAASYEATSRSVSVFNTGQTAASYEAISRELSVQNTSLN